MWKPHSLSMNALLVSILEPPGAIGRGVDKGLLAAEHLGDKATGNRSERQAVVRVAEREPEIAVPRRRADYRHHVGRARARAHPGLVVQPLRQRKEIARDRLGAAELHGRADRVARREL